MAHVSHEAGCGICSKLSSRPELFVFENELWQVRASDPPSGVPGWMMLLSQRHVAGPAQFDEREAQSFGPTLRHLQRILLELSGALRIYNAAMGESSPHFHQHMVPRYAQMPKDAKAWGVFDLQRAAAAGEIEADFEASARLTRTYAEALRAQPLPAV